MAEMTLAALGMVGPCYHLYRRCHRLLKDVKHHTTDLQDCFFDLGMQEREYAHQWVRLLSLIVDPEIAEDMLKDTKHWQWSDEDFQDACITVIGPDVVYLLERMKTILRSIEKRMPTLEAATKKGEGTRSVKKLLRWSTREKPDVTKLIDELKRRNQELETFRIQREWYLNNNRKSRSRSRSREIKKATRNKQDAKQLYGYQASVINVDKLLKLRARCCQFCELLYDVAECNCHYRHLRLPPDGIIQLKEPSRRSRIQNQMNDFTVLSADTSLEASVPEYTEIIFSPRKNEINSDKSTADDQRSVLISSPNSKKSIESLCTFLRDIDRKASMEDQPLRMTISSSPNTYDILFSAEGSVPMEWLSLEDLIRRKQIVPTSKERMQMALNLAACVLLYGAHPKPILRDSWGTKDIILVIPAPPKDSESPDPDSKPLSYVKSVCPGRQLGPRQIRRPPPVTIANNQLLFSLAVALIELGLWKRLSDLAKIEQISHPDYEPIAPFVTALELVKSGFLASKTNRTFAKVVLRCINCHLDEDVEHTDFREDVVQRAFCESVLLDLKRCLDAFDAPTLKTRH